MREEVPAVAAVAAVAADGVAVATAFFVAGSWD